VTFMAPKTKRKATVDAAAAGDAKDAAAQPADAKKKRGGRGGASPAASAAAAPAAAAAAAAAPSAAEVKAASDAALAQWTNNRSVWWDDAEALLKCVDQRNLPHSFAIASLSSVVAVESAIKTMLVRGAPAIGAAGGFGMAIAAQDSKADSADKLIAGNDSHRCSCIVVLALGPVLYPSSDLI
jgi:hypothetical protein